MAGWPTKHVHGILDPWKHGLVVFQYLPSKSCVFFWVVPGFGMIWPIKKLTSYGVHIGLICKVGDSITENIRNPPASPQGNKETSFGSGESSRNMIHALPLATLLFSLAGGLNILYIYKWSYISHYQCGFPDSPSNTSWIPKPGCLISIDISIFGGSTAYQALVRSQFQVSKEPQGCEEPERRWPSEGGDTANFRIPSGNLT